MGLSPAAVLYDAAGNAIKSIQDGADYLLGMATKLRNVAGSVVNPATEDKQDSAITKLTSLDGKDYATQTTLASILSGLVTALDVALSTRASQTTVTAIQSAIEAIRDTAGVKKITDQLPAGTNWIGKTAIGDGTDVAALFDDSGVKRLRVETLQKAGSFSNCVIYDNAGHAVGVVLDGSVYRFQVDAKVARGLPSGDLVHLETIDTLAGHGRLKTTVYTPDGDPVAFGAISSSLKNDFVKASGSPDLLVDGSSTPVVFEYLADATYDISLQEIKFTLASNSITFGTGYFGAIGGGLTNGMLVQVVANGGDLVTLYNMTRNESFVNFSSPGGFEWVVSSKDMMTSNYLIGGGLKLLHGTADRVKITVQDNITSAGTYFRCFVKGNLLTEI